MIVELDGYAAHGTRHRFETARDRDLALQVEGWRPVRVTWLKLRDRREELAADLAALLG